MKAYLISYTTLAEGMTEFLAERELTWVRDNFATDSELTVEAAGRICYMSFGKLQHRQSTQQYISNIVAQGHDSVLEHANFTILIDGITRGLSHQLVRHRIGFAYSQLSQQYHDESGADFIEPLELEHNPELRKRWEDWRIQTLSLYQDLLSESHESVASANLARREQTRLSRTSARSVLPNATATTLIITGNARAWRHLLEIRGNISGDLEMREYCVNVFLILRQYAPMLFDDFELIQDELGRLIQRKNS